ncbi:MAG: hypothetical protein HKN74_01785 [Acidimicrobiia bacterium]|nr:hypothetical protein [Acidimicrobiia bacterium]NNL71541.1 hypothetical protein [Acidimicrobiia bacterium]
MATIASERKRRLPRVRKVLRPLRRTLVLARGLALWGGGYLLTGVVPSRFDRAMSRANARRHARLHGRRIDELAAEMRHRLGPGDWRAAAADNVAMSLDEGLGRIRALHSGGWKPTIAIEGLHHLEAALEAENGVILWRMSSASSPIAKIALSRAGHPLVHLSHPRHGHSRWQGTYWVKHIPRWYATAENRFLAERVKLTRRGNYQYLRVLLDRLAENQVVSIMGDSNEGRQNVPVDILGETRALATGAPSLARRSGCVLLTSYTVFEGAQRYRVIIDPPIPVEQSDSRDAVARKAIVEYGRRLEEHIRKNPASWRGWEKARSLPIV